MNDIATTPGLRVSFDAPPGWTQAAAPGAMLALVAEAEPGHVRPNVTAILARHSAGFEVGEALADLRIEVATRPGGESNPPFPVSINGIDFTGCATAYDDPAAGLLLQVYLFATVADGEFVDLVQLVGTCGAGDSEQVYPQLQAVMRTVRIASSATADSPPAGGGD